jgi:predicted thioredoxin/glutaredoxin
MYSRTVCGLCDEARRIVLAERERSDFAYEERFVDGDDALEHEYGLRVPVVLVDGEVAFEAEVEPTQLRALLRG